MFIVITTFLVIATVLVITTMLLIATFLVITMALLITDALAFAKNIILNLSEKCFCHAKKICYTCASYAFALSCECNR